MAREYVSRVELIHSTWQTACAKKDAQLTSLLTVPETVVIVPLETPAKRGPLFLETPNCFLPTSFPAAPRQAKVVSHSAGFKGGVMS